MDVEAKLKQEKGVRERAKRGREREREREREGEGQAWGERNCFSLFFFWIGRP